MTDRTVISNIQSIQIKVGAVTSSISRNAGGLFFSVRSLAGGLSRLPGLGVGIHGIEDAHSADDVGAWSHLPLMVHRRGGPLQVPLAQAPRMVDGLIAGEYEVLHTQGIWQWPSVAVSQWHRKTGRPYLVSPRGMLDPWALTHSSWKKKLTGTVFENRHLKGAACLHALCDSEAESMRGYGLKNPICVIPNGIDLPEDGPSRTAQSAKKTLLFLGRLHPKKGLPNALRAWKVARDQVSEISGQEKWQFVIAGWDQGAHEADLKRLCTALGLTYAEIPASEFLTNSSSLITDHRSLGTLPSVLFVGPAFGQEKDALLRSASAFILPSFSEGLPMSILEAWSYRLPVLMTDHCNIPEGFAADAALRIGTDTESIALGILNLLQSTSIELQTLGQNGRALVERQFTWPQIAAQMKEVYEWVLGGGGKPSSIVR